jgi:pimeloyl-ACP methyl ester carboxylesterase
MPTARNGAIAIHYEVEGSGPPLLMHHGLTGSGQRWRDEGYVAALRDRFTLLLPDVRGHGQSAKPHDPASYDRFARAADVLAVLDAEGIGQAFFWGHSLGGLVGFTLGRHHPERLLGLVLTGFNPDPWRRAEAEEVASWVAGLRGGMETFVSGYEARHGVLPDEARGRWLANDSAALVACMEAWVAEGDGRVGAELPAIPAPTLLLVGSEEPFVAEVERAAAAMPDAAAVVLPGLDHAQTFFRSDLVLPHALAFLGAYPTPQTTPPRPKNP